MARIILLGHNGITSLLQTAKSHLKTSVLNEFQFGNDVEYL